MYYALAALIGALIAGMIAVNGGLTACLGVYTATVLIHVIGLLVVCIVALISRAPLLPKNKLPWYGFVGGAIGVATTVFNNVAFSVLSVSALLALGLFGQSIAALVIDHFGLFGAEKHPFKSQKLIGLAFVLTGIVLIMVL